MKKNTRTILIVVIVLALIFWLYTMTRGDQSKDAKQCCDVNYDNYNADCLNNTACQCDQSVCENTTPSNGGVADQPSGPAEPSPAGPSARLMSQPMEWGGNTRGGVPMYKYR
tara:strand:- start:126 stop:461 length:336 start_codon:yes stop_codon:yes gene_type:complete